MAWETFGGFALETRIMIRKIAIRHADEHNPPRRQTIYQINQRLSVALQQGVGGAADCLRVRRLIAGFAADTSYG